MKWRWVDGSRWRVDGVPDEAVRSDEPDKDWDYDGIGGRMGWVYYDNKVRISPRANIVGTDLLTDLTVAEWASWPGWLGPLDAATEVVSRC